MTSQLNTAYSIDELFLTHLTRHLKYIMTNCFMAKNSWKASKQPHAAIKQMLLSGVLGMFWLPNRPH